MEVTESGITTDFREVQLSNKLLLMEVIDLEMVIEVNAVHQRNAEFPIEVTEFGITTDPREVQL